MRSRGKRVVVASLLGLALGASSASAAPTRRSDAPPTVPCYPGAPAPQDDLDGIGAGGIHWTVALPDNPDSHVAGQTQPLVARGVAFEAMEGQLLAVRTSDGTVLWSIALTESPSTDLIDGSHLVLASYHHLTAYDRATGAVAWSTAIPKPVEGSLAPTVNHGVAFGMSGRTEVINLGNGSVRWLASGDGGVDPVIADSHTVLRIDPAYVEAFDALTGKRLWRKADFGTPVLTQGIVVAQSLSTRPLLGLNARTGKILWTRKDSYHVPVAAGGGVVMAYSQNTFGALDPRTGKQLWSASGVPGLAGLQLGFDRGIVVDLENSHTHIQAVAHRLSDGRVVWHAPQLSLQTGGLGPTVRQGSTFAATVDIGFHNAVVTSFQTVNGHLNWTVKLPLTATFPAALDGDNAVILTDSQTCFNAVPV